MKKKNLIIPIVLSALIFCIYPQAGDLDPTFNNGAGFNTLDFFGEMQIDVGFPVALQNDGKIIQGGTVSGGPVLGAAFGLTRYTTEGLLDTTFGVNGVSTVDITNFTDRLLGIAIQPDNKIIGVGTANDTDFAIVRYTVDGFLDPTFNPGSVIAPGIVVLDLGGTLDRAFSVALQEDGKIVAAGFSDASGNNDFAVVRLQSDGSLDTTFNPNGATPGIVITDISGGDDQAFSVVIQQDGKIVVGGSGNNTDFFALVRYLPNGTLDDSFGAGGIVITNDTNTRSGLSLVLQSDGKLVLAGLNSFTLARYNTDGSLDTTFGTNGVTTTAFGASRSLVLQPDGKLLLSGTFVGSPSRIALARYTTTGDLDETFGNAGTALINSVPTMFNNISFSLFSVLQPDGRLIVSTSSPDNNGDFLIARFLGDTLTVTKKASSENPCPGQNITYTITVTNFGAGGGTVNGILIEDVLPEELIFRSAQVSGSDSSSFDAATRVWSIPCLSIGDTAKLKINARVGQCAGNQVICNTAITSYSSIDNVTNSSLFEELGISITEIFSTTECVSTLPVIYENINTIANRTDCGVDDINTDLCNLQEKICNLSASQDFNKQFLKEIILKLDCLASFFSATDCLF